MNGSFYPLEVESIFPDINSKAISQKENTKFAEIEKKLRSEKLTDEKFVCDRCKEKKAENNNNYTFTTYREWKSGILCKSCYTYLKSEDYVKELHTIYPVWRSPDWGGYPFPSWDWADSISNTKGLYPITITNTKDEWYWLIIALLQTHGLSLEEVGNKSRIKLLFSSHLFPDHQVTLECAGAGREKNYYKLYQPKSMTVYGRQLEHEIFRLSHNTAIFWFNCNPRYIYLKSELLKEEGKKWKGDLDI